MVVSNGRDVLSDVEAAFEKIGCSSSKAFQSTSAAIVVSSELFKSQIINVIIIAHTIPRIVINNASKHVSILGS